MWIPIVLALLASAEPAVSPTEIAYSSAVCALREKRTRLEKAIRREKEDAAALSGFVDAAKLYRLQGQAVAVGDEADRLVTQGQAEGLRLRTCSDPIVSRLAACRTIWLDNGELWSGWVKDGECADAALAPFFAALRDPL
jgi:hypothetical protein